MDILYFMVTILLCVTQEWYGHTTCIIGSGKPFQYDSIQVLWSMGGARQCGSDGMGPYTFITMHS